MYYGRCPICKRPDIQLKEFNNGLYIREEITKGLTLELKVYSVCEKCLSGERTKRPFKMSNDKKVKKTRN
jgi:hypothetical protein